MPRYAYVAQATGAMREYMDAKRRGQMELAEQKYQVAMRGLEMLEGTTKLTAARESLRQSKDIFPSVLTASQQAARQAEITTREKELGIGPLERKEAARLKVTAAGVSPEEQEVATEFQEQAVRRAQAAETMGGIQYGQQIDLPAQRQRQQLAESVAAQRIAEMTTNINDQLMAMNYARASAETKMQLAEMEPERVQADIDYLRERTETEKLTRDPTIENLIAQAEAARARANQATDENAAQVWLGIQRMYNFMMEREANQYAMKTWGKPIAILKLEALQARGELSLQSLVSTYGTLYRLANPPKDLLTRLLEARGKVPPEQQQQMTETFKKIFEAWETKLIEGLELPALKVPPPGPPPTGEETEEAEAADVDAMLEEVDRALEDVFGEE